ncbi:MAG: CRISPR-associated ring nuclease Csm6 [Azospirillaceae bacterium]|nr:CRISPR-associated ring nuclease Csm6 [Azospirillaceae bacterium]
MKPVFIFGVGRTPQIVTETLWAVLHHEGRQALAGCIHILTTAVGATAVENGLLGAGGALARFYRDYDVAPMPLILHVLRDSAGTAVVDIRNEADNTRLANLICTVIRDLTATPDHAVHASVAGGRKTMSFYIGYALSLFGRPQDRLSHVLVAEDFESAADFWYPPPCSTPFPLTDGRTLDAATAMISLAEIPFLPLRDRLDAPVLQTAAPDFSEVVADLKRRLARPVLELVPHQRLLRFDTLELRLPPDQFAVYQLLALYRLEGEPDGGWLRKTDLATVETPACKRWLALYHEVATRSPEVQSLRRAIDTTITDLGTPWNPYSEKVAKVNRLLVKAAQTSDLWRDALCERQGRPHAAARLTLPPSRLRVVS